MGHGLRRRNRVAPGNPPQVVILKQSATIGGFLNWWYPNSSIFMGVSTIKHPAIWVQPLMANPKWSTTMVSWLASSPGSTMIRQVCLQGIGKHWKPSLRRSSSDGKSSFGVSTYGMSRKTAPCPRIGWEHNENTVGFNATGSISCNLYHQFGWIGCGFTESNNHVSKGIHHG